MRAEDVELKNKNVKLKSRNLVGNVGWSMKGEYRTRANKNHSNSDLRNQVQTPGKNIFDRQTKISFQEMTVKKYVFLASLCTRKDPHPS